jgi:hypothetical protein
MPLQKIPSTMLDFTIDIFTKDTLKIMAALAPPYIIGRVVDKKVHRCFYCPRHHYNVKQLPRWCYHCANHGLTVELIALSALSFYPCNKKLQTTAQVFAISLPLTWVGKKVLKLFKTNACLRPRNQYFDPSKKAYGGCPSGHMMEAAYAATLFGLSMGLSWGIPLGIFAGGIFVNFASANRHFTSQLIAGAGLGIIYGVSALRVTQSFMDSRFSCDIVHDLGSCGVRVAMDF